MTVLGERFQDDSLVDVPAWLEGTSVLGVQPGHLAGVLSVHHAQLRVLVDVALQRSQHYGEVSLENICYYRTMYPFLGFMCNLMEVFCQRTLKKTNILSKMDTFIYRQIGPLN